MAKWRNASLPTRLARVPIRVLFVRPVPWGFGSSGKEGEAAMRGMRSIPCHMYCMIWISSSDESKNNTAYKTLYFSFSSVPFSPSPSWIYARNGGIGRLGDKYCRYFPEGQKNFLLDLFCPPELEVSELTTLFLLGFLALLVVPP